MITRFMHVYVILLLAVSSNGCNADSDIYDYGNLCYSYVNKYISFREAVSHRDISSHELERYIYVHPNDKKDSEVMGGLIKSYINHEADIYEIKEYSARCLPNKNYASLSFKIVNADPKFNRLYIVIDKGKIKTLSKELMKSSESFDEGKTYLDFPEK